MPFLEETADLSLLSRSGPNGEQRDMTRGNRDITNRFTGYYSNIDYQIKSGIPEPVSPDILYLDSKDDYPPLFNQNNLFTIKFEGSRLNDIGENKFLDSYYSQVLSNDGLGIRNDNKSNTRNLGFSGFLNPQIKKLNVGINIINALTGEEPTKNTLPGFEVAPDREEPFIVRKIGEKWGREPRIPKPNLQGVIPALVQIDRPAYKGGDVIDSIFQTADDIGRRIVGREPSVFLDRYFADVRRINGATNALDFLIRGSRFVQAQDTLQKRNPFKTATTTMYQISDENTATITTDDYIPDKYSKYVPNNTLLSSNLNTRAYNPLSLFSIPGVMSINRSSYIDIGPIVSTGTIADFITQDVWGKIVAKGTEVIKDAATSIAKKWAKGKAEQLLEDNAPKVNQLKEQAGTYKKSAEKMVKDAEKRAQKLRDVAEYFDLIPAQENAFASKATLAKLGQNAFDDKGRDKVNLIPYGKDTYSKGMEYGTPLDELDWIPFKFKDVRNNKSMVFRAILSGISDTFSPEYASERYIGRPDPVYVYQGTTREIGFTFDVYPKSDSELVTLWEKLNYLAGQTYPHWSEQISGGKGMISPFTELTIGQMYTDTPGYISSLTYTVMDEGTYETVFAKLPKYIQVAVTFQHIGKRLPSATQKHFELPWVAEQQYLGSGIRETFLDALANPENFTSIGSRLNLGGIQDAYDISNKDRDFTLSGGAPFNPSSGKVPPAFGKSRGLSSGLNETDTALAGFGGGLNRTFTLGYK